MAFTIRFSEEKNQLLKANRGISFRDILEDIKKGHTLDDIVHPNQKYSHQRLYIVEFKGYVYAVPYVFDEEKQEVFLKTIYPSRTLMKQYKKGGKNEKTKE